ncbi:DUF4230 domain-containing protein [Schlesneria sp. T3-172]|uniref:DUF4230 domain-containing protein n=1 Tax=Schlesneria sphaerica TaxID=3373610 RepID=UPI0037C7E063
MTERIITPVLWWLVAILATVVAGMSFWIWLQQRSPEWIKTHATMPTVTQLEKIGELAATRVHITDVLHAEGTGHRGVWLISGDALLSCDMSKATLFDVDTETKSATIRLPQLRVVSARVNHDKTKTWSVEKTTWLPWKWGDQGIMRDAAMFHAQQLIETAASSERHHEPAREHAERLVQTIYELVEWNVAVEWE